MRKERRMTERQGARSTYVPETVADAFRRILHGERPWNAVGDFLEDWRSLPEARERLIQEEPPAPGDHPEMQRWAAFCAAMVEVLCQETGLPVPAWAQRPEYTLADPWYLYPGKHRKLMAWQEQTTPEPFKRRNIFGGDQILTRV
jgi:hypothetical protein